MKIVGWIAVVILVGGVALLFTRNRSGTMQPEKQTPLERLMAGNQRFVSETPIHPDQANERREELVSNQEPFAIILSCADSRVPPSIIFDQGIGDLFVVRVAGNVAGPIELDSIEFAADKLRAPLIFVLGHQNCGAVRAVMDGEGVNEDIQDIVPYILPALEKAKGLPGDPLENTIKANVELVIESLKKRPILSKLMEAHKLDIHGGYYEFDQGHVELLH